MPTSFRFPRLRGAATPTALCAFGLLAGALLAPPSYAGTWACTAPSGQTLLWGGSSFESHEDGFSKVYRQVVIDLDGAQVRIKWIFTDGGKDTVKAAPHWNGRVVSRDDNMVSFIQLMANGRGHAVDMYTLYTDGGLLIYSSHKRLVTNPALPAEASTFSSRCSVVK
jgi:hypothetical protein